MLAGLRTIPHSTSTFLLSARCISSGGQQHFRNVLREQIEGIKEAGTYKRERVITTPQRSSIGVQEWKENVLNFCANNYLGLSDHPEVVQASKNALDSHGAGLSSVRFICGTQDIHKKLERQVAKFHSKDDCILYPSCFDANGGLFESVLSNEDAVISDELNHASIIDGIRLCKASRFRYKHMNMEDLAVGITINGIVFSYKR